MIFFMIVLKIREGDSKYERGNLGKKQSKRAQMVLVSLTPFGMIIGCIVAIILSLLLATALLNMIVLGSAFGLLFGYFASRI